MERDKPVGSKMESAPVEIDIRKILQQIGIREEKWPAEFREKSRMR